MPITTPSEHSQNKDSNDRCYNVDERLLDVLKNPVELLDQKCPGSGIRIVVVQRSIFAISFAVRFGFLGLMKSMVINVEAELSVESILDLMAAIRPAKTSPVIHTGSIFATIVGNTRSGSVRFGKTENANTSGITMIKRIENFRKPPGSAPHRAFFKSLAPSHRCTIYCLVLRCIGLQKYQSQDGVNNINFRKEDVNYDGAHIESPQLYQRLC